MALPETNREQLFGRVLNRLHQIRSDVESDKYNTQVGRYVFPWRTGTISEEELDTFEDKAALVLRDLDETKATNSDHEAIVVQPQHGGKQKFIRVLHMQVEIACGGED